MRSQIITIFASVAICLLIQSFGMVPAAASSEKPKVVFLDEIHAKKIVVEESPDATHRVVIGSYPASDKGSIVSIERKGQPSIAMVNLDLFGPVFAMNQHPFFERIESQGYDFALSMANVARHDFRPSFQALTQKGKLRHGQFADIVLSEGR